MLFAIVYTGEHYIVDVLAGAVLAILCYAAAYKIAAIKSRDKKNQPLPEAQPSTESSRIYRAVISGMVILFIGIAIGSYNRGQFLNHRVDYNLYVPRYVDFFKHAEDFKGNYQIQFYLGSHYLFMGEYQKAIPYYERSLSLGRNDQEKERAAAWLKKCRELTRPKG
jgi:tetratricopeptide (TPR) repeat protein